jgi:hypothetical protein
MRPMGIVLIMPPGQLGLGLARRHPVQAVLQIQGGVLFDVVDLRGGGGQGRPGGLNTEQSQDTRRQEYHFGPDFFHDAAPGSKILEFMSSAIVGEEWEKINHNGLLKNFLQQVFTSGSVRNFLQKT